MSRLAPDGPWSGWVGLGPPVLGDPAVFENTDGRLEVLARGPEGLLGHVWQLEPGRDSGWWYWEDLGPNSPGGPAVFRNADGRHEVFAAGRDGQLGHTWQLHHSGHSGWSDWALLGPRVSGDPAMGRNADGRLEVFAAGPDGLLGHIWQLQPSGYSGWSGWEDLGPEISGPVAVSGNVDGRLEVFAAGPDGRLGHIWQQGPSGYGQWSDWMSLGPAISAGPAVFWNADGRLEAFATGPDGLLGHMWQLDPGGRYRGWSGWEDLGLAISSPPAVFRNADGRLEVFAAGPDGHVGHMWQLEPGARHRGWSSWEGLGPGMPGRRLAVCQVSDSGPGQLPAPAGPGPRASATHHRDRAFTADFCIIGAGPAGITVCDGLLRAGASVVLADSGGLEHDPAAQVLNHGVTTGPIVKGYWRYLRNGRRRQVQGSASGWGRGWCLPFRALDFAYRPWVELSGWPLGPGDLAPYEAKAAATFGFEAFQPPRPDGPLLRLSYHYPPDPLVFRAMFANLLAEPRLRAELGATAVELVVRGERVESVRLLRSDGTELMVAAGTVVLGAGGIENARLLLLHERTLPMASPMVGRCFMEHPHVLAGRVQLPQPELLQACLEDGPKLDVIALGDAAQYEAGLLNASVQLRPRDHDGDSAGPLECDLYVRAEQAPNPESRVSLGGRLDRLGFPWPVLNWQLLGQDWDSIVRSAALVAAALEDHHDAVVRLSIGTGAPWPSSPAGPADSANATWGFHHMGTTRMADRPDDGVVGPNCLVHGTANLYVAGSSVFPTGSCANPTFTIVALAHRLADHLATTFGP